MSDDAPPAVRWVADPSVPWWVGLTAVLDTPVSPEVALERLGGLAAQQGWAAPTEVSVGTDPIAVLLELCRRPPSPPVGLGIAGRHLVLAGHHSRIDGLGMLALLAAVTRAQVSSSARGLGERSHRAGLAAGTAGRLAEALFSPPARVARAGGSEVAGDRVALRSLAGTASAADLVVAGAAGVGAFNARHGVRTRRVAVAVGASRRPGTSIEPVNQSALLRLLDVETLSAAQVRDALRAAAPEPDPGAAGDRRLLGSAMALGLRLLAPRLGSTLLVSHLGTVAAAGCAEVVLHPVTAGGSGLSLGAGDDGHRTVLSLRGRARHYDDDALEEILEGIVDALARPPA